MSLLNKTGLRGRSKNGPAKSSLPVVFPSYFPVNIQLPLSCVLSLEQTAPNPSFRPEGRRLLPSRREKSLSDFGIEDKSGQTPLICYVTDRRSLREEDPAKCREALLNKIRKSAEAGVDWIQIREKDLSGRECARLTMEAMQRVKKATAEESSSARVLVNDRLDVALAAHADGVHLGEKSLPAQEARRLREALRRKKDFLIGVSCHSLEAAKSAQQGGADYIFFGPVFSTPSKAAYGSPQGLERLGDVCRALSIPVLAIGGITLKNFASCISVGASGIAAIRLFQDTAEVAAVVRTLRKISD